MYTIQRWREGQGCNEGTGNRLKGTRAGPGCTVVHTCARGVLVEDKAMHAGAEGTFWGTGQIHAQNLHGVVQLRACVVAGCSAG